MEPFGLALKEFYEGNKDAKVIFHRDDGLKDEYYVSVHFRNEGEFSSIDTHALALCHGKVLDIGAGVGPHSLKLQELGFEVVAIDISSHACDIMQKRGVKNAKCTTVYELKERNFDTILLMGRSIGFVENLEGLKKFLDFSRNLLNPKGQIILDSLDVSKTMVPDHLAYHERNRKLGRYIGVVELQIEYEGRFGERFKLLHVDPQTLNSCAQEVGWSSEIILEEEDGSYLCKIY
jgi:SAM-dependent methyltransferase